MPGIHVNRSAPEAEFNFAGMAIKGCGSGLLCENDVDLCSISHTGDN